MNVAIRYRGHIRHLCHKWATVNSGILRLTPIRLLSSNENDDDQNVPKMPVKTSREFIKKNPELKKLLSELYEDFDSERQGDSKKSETNLKASTITIYDEYRDEGARIIYDVDEEREIKRQKLEEGILDEDDNQKPDIKQKIFEGISLSHGVEGVFDIDDLVSILTRENCRDTVVLGVPPELGFVSHMVITTCSSSRHMQAVTEFVLKIIKQRMYTNRERPKIEGDKRNGDWIAMDLGNIALHLFLQSARENYDLEQLWIVGREFDEKSQLEECSDELADVLKDLQNMNLK